MKSEYNEELIHSREIKSKRYTLIYNFIYDLFDEMMILTYSFTLHTTSVHNMTYSYTLTTPRGKDYYSFTHS